MSSIKYLENMYNEYILANMQRGTGNVNLITKYINSFLSKKKSLYKCGAIIFSSDYEKILLVKNRKTHKWGLPKGSLKPRETYYDCATREVWEETGVNLYNSGKVLGSVVLDCNFYLVVHMHERVKLNIIDKDEISSVNFIKIKDIPRLYSNLNLKCFYIYHTRFFKC